MRQRSGLIGFTGPHFSGKNAAIYSCLHELQLLNRSMAFINWSVRGGLQEVHDLREMIDTETAELSMLRPWSPGWRTWGSIAG